MMIFDANIVGPWVAQRVGMERYVPGTASAIGQVRDGKIISGVLYEDYNGANVTCHIAGEGRNWLNRKFLSIIFDYPFNQLGVKRITGYVLDTNKAAQRLDEHLGFKREATLRDAHPEGDIIIYCMTADECRWLKELPYDRVFSTRNP